MGALRDANLNYTEALYAVDFPYWFLKQANDVFYRWNWTKILMDMREGRFFQNTLTYTASDSITGEYLSESGAQKLAESLIQSLRPLQQR